MVIITGHNMLDFDALASMVAAKKLYPEAQLVFSGLVSKSTQEFTALNKDLLNIKRVQAIDIEKVKHLIVVDTADPKRLFGFEEILAKPDLVIDIYDHHRPVPGDLEGDFKQIEMTGAAATLLVERLREQQAVLNEFEATTIAMGIYADTGGMMYDSTTPRDIEAAAWLLKQGANLEIIRENMDQRLSDQQMEVFHQCLLHMQLYSVSGVDILICKVSLAKRISGLDVVTMRLFSIEGAEAIFVLAEDPKSIEIIGRSSSQYVDVFHVLQELGGRGHARAASAVIKKNTMEQVSKMLRESIDSNVHPSRCAKDVMSTPVKTLPPETSLEEADKVMLRCGHTGMPIVQNGRLVGMISRRDVDKARMHNLEHAPVKGFMSTHLIKASLDTPLDQLQTLIVTHNIGRVPIVKDEEIVGIVSRTDILREIYQKKHEQIPASSVPEQDSCHENRVIWNYAEHMHDILTKELLQILYYAGNIAEKNGQKIYVVGGFVRDLLLDLPNQDIDLVVEGDSRALAEELAEKIHGRIRYYDRFQTANIILPDKTSVDIVTARAEYYEYPAALPHVEKSCIREDLYRRDFTINAMALCLNPGRFGDLFDFFGGREDLKNKLVRVLYHFSFIEDPTRIVRAVRFAKRYRFAIEPDTMRLALDALKRGMLSRLSQERFWHEVMLILKEANPLPALQELRHLNILTDALPQFENNNWTEEDFYLAKKAAEWWHKHMKESCQMDVVHVMIFLLGMPEVWRTQIIGRLNLKAKVVQNIEQLAEMLPWLQSAEWKEINFSTMEEKLRGLSVEAVLYCMVKSGNHGRKKIRHYILRCQEIKVFSNGTRLKELGFEPGPDFNQILTQLYHMHLDGKISTQEEEEAYLHEWKKGELFH